MSSTYRLLCLAHTPALTISSYDQNVHRAEEIAAAGPEGHPHCDIVISRYSGGLIELGCPDSTVRRRQGCYHRGTSWADATLLRLLALAQREPEGTPLRAVADQNPGRGCWTPERLATLTIDLDLPKEQLWPTT